MASLHVLLATVFLVQLLQLSSATSIEGLDVTRFFSFEASSTCGETPPSGSGSSSSGDREGLQLSDCPPGERNVSFALDGDVESWWQSEDGASPVELTFSLQSVS